MGTAAAIAGIASAVVGGRGWLRRCDDAFSFARSLA